MVTTHSTGVLDTSVLIGLEAGRDVDMDRFPEILVTTVITKAEIEVGVLSAPDNETMVARLETRDKVRKLRRLQVDNRAAQEWARLRVFLAQNGRRMEVNDLWIAAIATAHKLPVVTQDADFEALEDAPGVQIIRV